MSWDNLAGTFLSGGFKPSPPPVDLPESDQVTLGTLYRDERGQIWRADRLRDRRGQQWVRVTEVSAEQQRRDRVLGFVFAAAALVGSFLVFQLVDALGLDWGLLLVTGTFIAFGVLSFKASERVGHQVVLPTENSVEIPNERSSLEAPGRGE